MWCQRKFLCSNILTAVGHAKKQLIRNLYTVLQLDVKTGFKLLRRWIEMIFKNEMKWSHYRIAFTIWCTLLPKYNELTMCFLFNWYMISYTKYFQSHMQNWFFCTCYITITIEVRKFIYFFMKIFISHWGAFLTSISSYILYIINTLEE